MIHNEVTDVRDPAGNEPDDRSTASHHQFSGRCETVVLFANPRFLEALAEAGAYVDEDAHGEARIVVPQHARTAEERQRRGESVHGEDSEAPQVG